MKKAIGIDLGTTNSVVAFKDTNVKILRNKENDELTRSCVALSKGEFLVGKHAYGVMETNPINTILSIKRLMGGAIKDKMVQEMIDSPYYKFGITSLKGGTDDAVAVILGGKEYTPEQISSEILKKLKSDAEERLGDEVTHAVITVPAYFTEKQKNATRIAAQLAGLKVQRLLSEPTAAAIAYGVDNLKAGDATTVMIYDFGGGTFDLSILNIVDGQYMEAGTTGDRWLGGDDLDQSLEELVLNKISEQHNISDVRKLIQKLSDKNRWRLESKMRVQTEAAKIQLSSAKSAPIMIDNLLEDESGDIIDIDITVTREEFERLVEPFIKRTIELINHLLKKVGYEINMIDSILLVGGTSCIPLIKQMISNEFKSVKIKVSEKPMLAVAEGAAILAHRLGEDYEPELKESNSIKEISHTTNHNYFIQLKDGYKKIIDEQNPKPISISTTFKTTVANQKIVKVSLWSDIEKGGLVEETNGFFTIEDSLPLGSEIVFDISLDLDEVFDVKVYPKNNKSKNKQIVLGRGNKDSKALKFISDCFDKVLGNEYSEKQREYFLKIAQKEIEKINTLGLNNGNSEKWEEIGTNTFAAFEQAERITSEFDEDAFAITCASILTNEYAELLDSEDRSAMKQLLAEIKHENDVMAKLQAAQKLRQITDEYPLLINLFTIKIASTTAAKTNPSDAHKLLLLHDQIVGCFRDRKKDEGMALFNEAIELRDKYQIEGIDLNSIHLTA